jgi:hypothetical protein
VPVEEKNSIVVVEEKIVEVCIVEVFDATTCEMEEVFDLQP